MAERKSQIMSENEAKQQLMNLVERYNDTVGALKLEVSEVKTEVKFMNDKVDKIDTVVSGMENKFKEMFAKKLVETIVFSAIGIVLTTVLMAGLGLVIVKNL
jgi:predicted nuclease with TOPRIM domain